MTRKDFVLIADALLSARNECQNQAELDGVNRAIDNLAWKLQNTNSRFDRERFTRAAHGRR